MPETPTLRSSRPNIKIDGELKAELAPGLLGLLVEENTEGLYRCELTVGNWGGVDNVIDYLYFDRRLFDFGKQLAIEAEGDGDSATIFSGRIMALEAHYAASQTPTLTVLAEDRLQDLRMTRRTRTFENLSDEEIIRQIAQQHSLQPTVELDGASVQHRVLAQVNQSDLAFLRERAQALGAELWVDGTTLYAKARSRRGSPEVRLTYGANLIEFTVLADLAHQRTSLSVAGWDPGAKDAVTHEAAQQAISGEVSGGQSGPQLLQAKLGERKEQLVHLTPASDGEARAMAEAAFRRIARRFVTGTGVVNGDPRLRVGVTVNLQGLGALFDGKYYVTEARHTFDLSEGYRTQIRVERPFIGS